MFRVLPLIVCIFCYKLLFDTSGSNVSERRGSDVCPRFTSEVRRYPGIQTPVSSDGSDRLQRIVDSNVTDERSEVPIARDGGRRHVRRVGRIGASSTARRTLGVAGGRTFGRGAGPPRRFAARYVWITYLFRTDSSRSCRPEETVGSPASRAWASKSARSASPFSMRRPMPVR